MEKAYIKKTMTNLYLSNTMDWVTGRKLAQQFELEEAPSIIIVLQDLFDVQLEMVNESGEEFHDLEEDLK